MAILAGYRLSMIFAWAGQKTGGWTENFWNSAAFPIDGTTPIPVSTLIDKRQAMTSNQCYIKSYRLADLSTTRNVLTKGTGFSFQTPLPLLAGDIPQAKLSIILRGSGNYHTLQWLGGIPDIQIKDGGVYTPGGSWPTALAAFLDLLKGSGWSICNQNRTAVNRPVDNITNAGVVTAIAHPFSTGDYVRIKNVRGFAEANRIWRITKLTVDTFQLIGWVAYQTSPVFYGPHALATKQDPVLTAITGYDKPRGSKHDVGRPPDQLSGRRRRPRPTPALLLVAP